MIDEICVEPLRQNGHRVVIHVCTYKKKQKFAGPTAQRRVRSRAIALRSSDLRSLALAKLSAGGAPSPPSEPSLFCPSQHARSMPAASSGIFSMPFLKPKIDDKKFQFGSQLGSQNGTKMGPRWSQHRWLIDLQTISGKTKK